MIKRYFVRGVFYLLALTAAMAFMPGCAKSDGKNDSGAAENRTEDIMAKELSEDEIEVLCRMFIDEERIKAGRLTAYMEYTLAQFRYLKAYLAEKYPETKFEFSRGTKQTAADRFATFKFREGGNESEASSGEAEPKREFWANVYGNNDDKPATLITDNYYAVAAEEKYEDYLKKLLGDDFGNIVSLNVEILEERSYGFDLETPIGKYLAELSPNAPWIQICLLKEATINETEINEFAEKVEEIVREHDVRGSFVVAVVDDMGCNHTYTKSEYIYSVYFNNFL